MKKQKNQRNQTARNGCLRTIYGIAKELGMDNEDLHAFLKKQNGKDSFKKCTDRQLELMVSAMKYLQGVDESQRGKATAKQKRFIHDLEYQLGWSDAPERLRAFCRKMFWVENVTWLTVEQASKLIEALKSMRDGGRNERKGGAANG